MSTVFNFEQEPFEFELASEFGEEFEADEEGELDQEGFDSEAADSEGEEEVRRGRFFPPRGSARFRQPVRPGGHQPRPPKRPLGRIPVPRRTGVFGPGVIGSPASCTCPAHGTEYVRWVQSSLNQVSGVQLPITGIMTAATRSILKQFQDQQGLMADGIAGPETERALIEAKGGKSAPGQEPPEPGEFEAFEEEADRFDEFAHEFETDPDPFRWPRERTFNPPPAQTIPSGPYQTGSGLCPVIQEDLQDLILSIGPFNQSVELLYKLTKQKPRDQNKIDDTGKQARRQMSNLKINLEKMRDRTKKGFYRTNGCTDEDIAKVTCKVRNLQGAWRRIASMEKLRDQLVYWLRNSRGSYASVDCKRL